MFSFLELVKSLQYNPHKTEYWLLEQLYDKWFFDIYLAEHHKKISNKKQIT